MYPVFEKTFPFQVNLTIQDECCCHLSHHWELGPDFHACIMGKKNTPGFSFCHSSCGCVDVDHFNCLYKSVTHAHLEPGCIAQYRHDVHCSL